MKTPLTAVVVISTLFLTSCAMDPSQKQEEALAKSFKPKPGRANVYVSRPATLTPWAPRFFHIELNGEDLGPAPDTDRKFLLFDVAPGSYTIATSEKRSIFAEESAAKYEFKASAGDNVFMEFRPKFAVNVVVASTPSISWTRATEEEGRRNILKSKLLKSIETVN